VYLLFSQEAFACIPGALALDNKEINGNLPRIRIDLLPFQGEWPAMRLVWHQLPTVPKLRCRVQITRLGQKAGISLFLPFPRFCHILFILFYYYLWLFSYLCCFLKQNLKIEARASAENQKYFKRKEPAN
jgi:hypothetical protein